MKLKYIFTKKKKKIKQTDKISFPIILNKMYSIYIYIQVHDIE